MTTEQAEYDRAAAFVDVAMGAICLPDVVPAAQWFRDKFRDERGRVFNEQMVPWVTAPGGPCDAIDSKHINRLYFQWAARMFKTQFCQGVMMKYAEEDPCSMMFATVDEKNCHTVFGRYWKMLEASEATRDQVPPPRMRGSEDIKLARCTIYGAWTRSKSALADKSIRVGHGNEIDKWVVESTTTEGDPIDRFLKRGSEYPDHKFMFESTPSVKGKSKVEAGRLASCNSKYYVPCPHCGKFDTIEFGDGKEKRGLFWETRDGRNDPDYARKTAYYVCGHCHDTIGNEHRSWMVNRGVWVPEGCQVDHDRAVLARELPQFDTSYLIGDPLRRNDAWGSQISVFYAPFLTWGDIAKDFLEKKKTRVRLQQWTNENKGETWEVVANQQTWEQLANLVITEDKSLGSEVVPDWAKFITFAADAQQSDYPFSIEAWGVDGRNHTVRRGRAESMDWLFHNVVDRGYRKASGGEFKISMGLIDGGFKPKDSHEFSKRCRREGYSVWVCKGSKSALDFDYSKAILGEKTSAPGELLIHVDTTRSQYHMEAVLADPRGKFSVFHDSVGWWQDYFEELLNDAAIEHIDSTNNAIERWQRIDETMPNDHRDVKRYNWVAKLLVCKDIYHADEIREHHPVLDVSHQQARQVTTQRKESKSKIRPMKVRGFRGGIRRG